MSGLPAGARGVGWRDRGLEGDREGGEEAKDNGGTMEGVKGAGLPGEAEGAGLA